MTNAALREKTVGIAAGFLALALAGAGTALASPQCPYYMDYQWKGVKVADTNADNNVRHQNDMTVPLHGPWLSLPSENTMTVTWITRVKCAAGIRYWEKGTTNVIERWNVKCGMPEYTKTIHAFHLSGLKPGTDYEYRLLSNMDRYMSPYSSVLSEGRETYSFRTFDRTKKSYRTFVSSDIHGGFRLNLYPMLKCSEGEKSDLFILAGDLVEDGPYNDLVYYATFGFLDDIVNVWGSSKPTVFLRGNHDCSQFESYRWGELFPQPDGKTYTAFAHGPAYYICLDTMMAFKREPLKQKAMLDYLQEQREWLKRLKTTKEFRESKFRLAFFHFPLFPSESNDVASGWEAFGDIFAEESPEGRVHAVITGHEHCYARINPNTKEGRVNNEYNDFPKTGRNAYPAKWFCRQAFPDRFPYVSIVCRTSEALTIDVSEEKLVFKSHRWGTAEGGLYDAFEVTADGKVTDLVKTTVVPWPQPAPKTKK